MEKELRKIGLSKLEDETTKHFSRVSKDIISELDKLGSSLQVRQILCKYAFTLAF